MQTLLAEHPNLVQVVGSRHVGESRLNALKGSVADAAIEAVHYCDFDRLVHWHVNYPDELQQILAQIQQTAGYLALGRTPRAFETHPVVQREPEYMTNRLFSWIYGETQVVYDVVAGSCAMDRASAEFLCDHSVELSNATDCEWPMLIKFSAEMPVTFVETEGLEFETPTFFGDQVHQASYNPDNWLNRVRLAKNSIEATMQVYQSATA